MSLSHLLHTNKRLLAAWPIGPDGRCAEVWKGEVLGAGRCQSQGEEPEERLVASQSRAVQLEERQAEVHRIALMMLLAAAPRHRTDWAFLRSRRTGSVCERRPSRRKGWASVPWRLFEPQCLGSWSPSRRMVCACRSHQGWQTQHRRPCNVLACDHPAVHQEWLIQCQLHKASYPSPELAESRLRALLRAFCPRAASPPSRCIVT